MLAPFHQVYKRSLKLEALGQEHRNQTLSHFCLPLEPELDPQPAHIVTQELRGSLQHGMFQQGPLAIVSNIILLEELARIFTFIR